MMIDGIDGSGKGTAANAVAEWMRKKGKKVFDVVAYEKEHGTLPELADFKSFHLLVVAEPTHSLIGKAIREELIHRNGRSYSPETIAQAFSMDRLILYTKVILPALARGIDVVQERGVSTSICYQPLQSKSLTVQSVAKREGNALALRHTPDILLIMSLSADDALRRLRGRTSKRDNSMYEKLAFLTKANRRFQSRQFQNFFAKRGSRVVVVNAGVPIAKMKRAAIELWEKYME
jgi:dTMP kinase